MKLIKTIILSVLIGQFIVGCHSGSSSGDTTTVTSYQFVIDAGSSGSRIYVYSVNHTQDNVVITNLYDKKVSTPLTSFANNPNDVKDNIQPLLNSAIEYLTKYNNHISLQSVKTSVLGTAGMRALSASEQTSIYQNISQTIVNDGLKLDQVKTISGENEALYSWADVNYLQNNFNNKLNTVGIFEIGGASAQVAFATKSDNYPNVIHVILNDRIYNVYVISFLGLGQDAIRGTINSMQNHDQCYPVDYSNGININGDFNFAGCSDIYKNVIEQQYPIVNAINQITDFYDKDFVGIGSIYYALKFWHIENNPMFLESSIKQTCTKSFDTIKMDHADSLFQIENQCANATFINEMLNYSLEFHQNQIIAMNQINNVPLSWTLGFTLLN